MIDPRKPNVPNWFNLQNYDDYKSLSSKKLCEELMFRFSQHFVLKLASLRETAISEKEAKNSHLFNITRKSIKNRTGDEQERVNNSCYQFRFDSNRLFTNQSNKAVTKVIFRDIENYLLPKQYLEIHYYQEIEKLRDYYYDHLFDEKLERDERQKIYESYINSNFNKIKESAKKLDEAFFVDNDIRKIQTEIGTPFVRPTMEESAEDEVLFLRKIYKDTSFEKALPRLNFNLNEFTFLKVNLGLPDELLIEEFLKTIKRTREKRNLSKNNRGIEFKELNRNDGAINYIKSLIDKRIIQYIDLYLWAKSNNYSPTLRWYIDTIFEDRITKGIEIPDQFITNTVKKIAKKWMNDNWIFSFYHFDLPSYNTLFDNNNY
ncbi:DUF6387 family protein [Marinicella sp. S1101]|uniref:DUF6387 family protein n=1 Tax=Marinicella marina TaxID=2996016 RepID=UPI002260A480|nr:DUF6387 family protein [Marinicella marina]MCX7554263.1 DUF6387 family protein [Marinicella marina]